MRWAEMEVQTNVTAQEAVEAIMFENGCGGLAIQGETPVFIKCYLPVDDRLEERISNIQSGIANLTKFGLDPAPAEITIKYAEEQEWAEAWRQFFRTTRVGKHIVIKPPWEKFNPEPGDVVIEIEAGMAFGTGQHPTTRMSLEALEKRVRQCMTVVDFGTGSGILAIAAAKLGACLVIAFDIDELAVRAARENVQRNNEEEHIEVHQTDNLGFIQTTVDLITANIVAETITKNAPDIARVLRRGGILIASGIVDEKSADVERALRNEGFDIAEILKDGEWTTLVAHKAS
ncbi:MAG: 50S ribosomal protein L11 methyltransferase [Armatimonadetes bacterium]|nr:50S ribosomal protein L11 methyltransferase [Armatimonadota bacterium]